MRNRALTKTLRLLTGAVQWISPRAAAAIAFHLFCTPPRPRFSSEAERNLSERAEKRLAKARAIDVAYSYAGKDETMRAYRFDPETEQLRQPIILLHGWTGRAAFMLPFAGPLLNAGHSVIAVDLPAHGASSGRQLHMPRALAGLQALHDLTGPWHGMIAHSFGGAVAAAAASGFVPAYRRVPLRKLAMIASPHSLKAVFHGFGKFIGLNASSQQLFDGYVLELAERPLVDFEVVDMLREANVSTLLLHAPDDKEVRFSGAEIMSGAGDHVALEALPGLGHRRILYASQTIKSATKFILTDDAASSSGRLAAEA